MIIIGTEAKKFDGLFGANGEKLELVGEAEPIVVKEEVDDTKLEEQIKEKEMTEDEKILAEVARLQEELEALKNGGAPMIAKKEGGKDVKKGSKVSKGKADRKYVRLGELKTWGKVPQQQADLAAIISESLDVGSEWTEEELFDLLVTGAKDYASLHNSKMSATYLFQSYRGLKNDGKHAGFIARNFLRMV